MGELIVRDPSPWLAVAGVVFCYPILAFTAWMLLDLYLARPRWQMIYSLFWPLLVLHFLLRFPLRAYRVIRYDFEWEYTSGERWQKWVESKKRAEENDEPGND